VLDAKDDGLNDDCMTIMPIEFLEDIEALLP